MAIPDVCREQIIAAIEQFDRELRQAAEWSGWEQRDNHRYAIQHEGRLYPVKQTIACAKRRRHKHLQRWKQSQ